MKTTKPQNRTAFSRQMLALSICTLVMLLAGCTEKKSTALEPAPAEVINEDSYFIGPRTGYSPQIGTLISMLNYNRETIISTVKGMSMEDLDYLHDEGSNTIAGMIMHLGATEKFYQINTLEGRQEFNEEEDKVWGAAMRLGDEGRASIKGKEVSYYLDMISEVRNKTLEEFKKKDDAWLMEADSAWSKPDAQLNTYWKWFHVCEHESNHRGQITWIKSRLPSAQKEEE